MGGKGVDERERGGGAEGKGGDGSKCKRVDAMNEKRL